MLIQFTFLLTDRFNYSHLFCKSTLTAVICQHAWSVPSKTELLWHLNYCFLTITRDHARWSLTGNKTKEYTKFLVLKVVVVVLKQYLNEKQNCYFQSGHLREVVGYEKWSPWETVDVVELLVVVVKAVMVVLIGMLMVIVVVAVIVLVAVKVLKILAVLVIKRMMMRVFVMIYW